ncbi:MAG: hypothetical protein ACI9TY_001719 [Alphaproteobacteria bacterium]|jgi:hypothetical protein
MNYSDIMNKAITLTELLIPVSKLLSSHVKQCVKVKVITKTVTASIHFSDNRFPTDLVNTGVPGVDDWQGDHDILEALRSIKKEGFQVEMYAREIGDETDYTEGLPQDFKIVISPHK